jgi:hypothetical protein
MSEKRKAVELDADPDPSFKKARVEEAVACEGGNEGQARFALL